MSKLGEEKERRKNRNKVVNAIMPAVSFLLIIITYLFWVKGEYGKEIPMKYLTPSWIVFLLCSVPLFVRVTYNAIKKKHADVETPATVAVFLLVLIQILVWALDITLTEEYDFLFTAVTVSFLISLGDFASGFFAPEDIHASSENKKKASLEVIVRRWGIIVIPFAVVVGFLTLMICRFTMFDAGAMTETEMWLQAAIRMSAVLIVFSPASFAVAAPSAVQAGIKRVAEAGALIPDGKSLEKLCSMDVMCFEMTGVLTTGNIRVVGYVTEMDDDVFGMYVSEAEKDQTHPAGKAIREYFVPLKELHQSKVSRTGMPGEGVGADVDGKKIIIAKWAYFNRFAISAEMHIRAQQWLREGCIVVGVAADNMPVGAIALTDEPRESSAEVISLLKANRITPVILTGDNAHRTQRIADLLGVEIYRNGLMPEGRANVIGAMKKDGRKVAFCGIKSEEYAFRSADAAIVVDEEGSGVKTEGYEADLIVREIKSIPSIIKYTRDIIFGMKINIAAIIFVEVCAAVMICFGLITPVYAAVLHVVLTAVTSISVFSLFGKNRLKRHK